MMQDNVNRDGAIKILIIEDRLIEIKGLQVILEDFSDQVKIIGYAKNVEDAKKRIQELKPDLVLLDLHLPQAAGALSRPKYQHGVELIEELGKIAKETRILVLSEFGRGRDYETYRIHPEILKGAISARADSYVAKDDHYDGDALTDAIKRTMRGEAIFSPLAAEAFRESLDVYDRDSEDSVRLEPLAPREREVLLLLDEGLANKEIAKRLHLTVDGVKAHCHRIYRKLGATGRNDPKIRRTALRIRIGDT